MLTMHRLAMGNVREFSFALLRNHPDHLRFPGPFPRRPHTHNWSTKDSSLLRSTAKVEGHSSICGWHHTHINTVAASRLPRGAVWDICALWGLLLDDWRLCWEHTSGGTLHTTGIGQGRRWKEERGITCLRFGRVGRAGRP